MQELGIHKKTVEHKFEFLMRPPPSMTYRQKPRLREEIRSLMSAIDNTTNPPTAPQIERIASLIKEVDEQEETLMKLFTKVSHLAASYKADREEAEESPLWGSCRSFSL